MNRLLYSILLILAGAGVFAQAPAQFNYQAVVRDDGGHPIINENVVITIDILDAPQGESLFSETHQIQTNEFGLVSLQVGSEKSMESIDWSTGNYFIQISLNGLVMGTSQLLSVPFAMHATTSSDTFSGNYEDLQNAPDLSSYVSAEGQFGDILVRTYEGWEALPRGQEGQVLRIVGAKPQWADLPSTGEEEPETGSISDVQGNSYSTRKIGSQWWMIENLRTSQYRNGEELVTGLNGQDWEYAVQGAYAIYNGSEDNHNTYGKLYNWLAAMDPRGLCPTGWKIPSDEDWKLLEMTLGMTQEQADGVGSRGNDEGGKLKATSLWNDPNTGATNESGYTALPGGIRTYLTDYIFINEWAYFWTSTEHTDNYSSWYRVLQYNSQQVFRYYNDQRSGMSVRCIKEEE